MIIKTFLILNKIKINNYNKFLFKYTKTIKQLNLNCYINNLFIYVFSYITTLEKKNAPTYKIIS